MTRLQDAEQSLRHNVAEAEKVFISMEPNQEYWLEDRTPSGHAVGFVEVPDTGGATWCIVIKEPGGKTGLVKNLPILQQMEIFRPEFGVLQQLYEKIDKSSSGRAGEMELVVKGIRDFLNTNRKPLPNTSARGD